MFKRIILIALFLPSLALANSVSEIAQQTADYAVEQYSQPMLDSLARLVQYNTVAIEGISVEKNPANIAFKNELAKQAKQLELDFQDFGSVVIIGLGNSKQRLGVITHGDVQPVDASKWKKSPFELDTTSEPGNLIARGTEDDKGPISTAMFAMKAIKDKNITLGKRIELYVYMAEESDWEPLKKFIKTHSLPQLNITIDAEYPVVTAEKGWTMLKMTFPKRSLTTKTPYLLSFSGGAFASQIPEDAKATIENADQTLLKKLQAKSKLHSKVRYQFELDGGRLSVTASGKAAHSSKPEDGVNAITHLADLLSIKRWPNNSAGGLVNFLNDHIGLNLYGKKFGQIAYRDDFMGPMTVSPTVLKQMPNGIQLSINMRRPRGKSKTMLEAQINSVIEEWQQQNKITLLDREDYIGDPFVQSEAPHVQTLLNVFSHFTGIKNAQPVSIGGGTNSRLFPNAVSFGPSMPNTKYTGHSEHEFITMEQFLLNLKMYTAVLIELAAEK